LFVPDIVMLSRHKNYMQKVNEKPRAKNHNEIDELEFCIRQEKYDRSLIFYDVWIVPKAKTEIKLYIKEFPQIIDFLRKKNIRNEFRSTEQSRKYITVHELYNIDPMSDQDPNINLFKIYSWLLKCSISNLKLYSGLSLNADKEKMESVLKIHKKNKKSTKPKDLDYRKEYSVNKHDLIINNINQKIAYPPMYEHPPYPDIGDRIVVITNESKKFN